MNTTAIATQTMTSEQSEAASGYDAAVVLTADNVEAWAEPMGGPLDMIEEIEGYCEDGDNWALFFSVCGDELYYCYLSNGRGGVATNGYTDWTDCESLEDLMDRWDDYDNRWAN